jgi:hypothetical protein
LASSSPPPNEVLTPKTEIPNASEIQDEDEIFRIVVSRPMLLRITSSLERLKDLIGKIITLMIPCFYLMPKASLLLLECLLSLLAPKGREKALQLQPERFTQDGISLRNASPSSPVPVPEANST